MIICNPNSRDWARADAENFKQSRNVKLKRQRHILCRTLENLIHEVILRNINADPYKTSLRKMVKMSTLPKFIYVFHATPVKILVFLPF